MESVDVGGFARTLHYVFRRNAEGKGRVKVSSKTEVQYMAGIQPNLLHNLVGIARVDIAPHVVRTIDHKM
jgi:hypothetical protein